LWTMVITISVSAIVLAIALPRPLLLNVKTEIPCEGNRVVIEYSAMEVFARNLTAGWYACGDEALNPRFELVA
jgi:hypothetical protein